MGVNKSRTLPKKRTFIFVQVLLGTSKVGRTNCIYQFKDKQCDYVIIDIFSHFSRVNV